MIPDTRLPPTPRIALAVLAILLSLAVPEAGAQAPVSGARRLPGDRPLRKFPETDDIRSRLRDEVFLAPMERAMALKPRLELNDYGSWRLRVEIKPDAFYLLLVPKADGSFPVWGQGAWIVKRSRRDGSVTQAKVFMRGDQEVFLRIYPFADRAKMDVVAYGGVLRREVILPVPIDRLLVAPVADIVRWTSGTVEWSLFSPDPGLYADSRKLIASVRERLPLFDYVEDGAFDGSGKPVFISTGKPQPGRGGVNCSGFAKWLVDGIIKPVAGSWLEIEPLKERREGVRGTSFTSPYETSLDPFFGLDWSRNLAFETARAMHPSLVASPAASREKITDNDVLAQPFGLIVPGLDPLNGGGKYETYPIDFPTGGYRVDGLEAVLYILAMREPGRFYLAAFNVPDSSAGPELRRYTHVAALFPYFEPDGRFAIAVFESGAETGMDSLTRRYGGAFARLVRFPAEAEFDPPPLPPR
ncbi:MAG: hypothetical protein NT080_06225 [Spirochaetes bacterium]|nr:hypothetical protein [Spirochaetota bacterium]